MVRSEYKYHMLRVWVFDFAQQDGREGNRQAYPCRMSVAGERPSLDEQRAAAQLALSSPPGKEGRGPRGRTDKSWEGGVLPHQPDSSCSWAGERGGRRTGAGGAKGGRWVAVPKERALLPCQRRRHTTAPPQQETRRILPPFLEFFLEFRSHIVKGLSPCSAGIF